VKPCDVDRFYAAFLNERRTRKRSWPVYRRSGERATPFGARFAGGGKFSFTFAGLVLPVGDKLVYEEH
jgi:hypothetical protein